MLGIVVFFFGSTKFMSRINKNKICYTNFTMFEFRRFYFPYKSLGHYAFIFCNYVTCQHWTEISYYPLSPRTNILLHFLFMLQDTVLFTNMHMVLQLQPVIAANILQKDVRIRNTRHIIVRASINVRLLLILLSDKVLFIEDITISFLLETKIIQQPNYAYTHRQNCFNILWCWQTFFLFYSFITFCTYLWSPLLKKLTLPVLQNIVGTCHQLE